MLKVSAENMEIYIVFKLPNLHITVSKLLMAPLIRFYIEYTYVLFLAMAVVGTDIPKQKLRENRDNGASNFMMLSMFTITENLKVVFSCFLNPVVN